MTDNIPVADLSERSVDRAVETEEMEEDSPEAMLAGLRMRVVAFLREQADVTELDEIGDGFYGFRLTAAGDVSMVLKFTSGNELANGQVAP